MEDEPQRLTMTLWEYLALHPACLTTVDGQPGVVLHGTSIPVTLLTPDGVLSA